MKMEIKRNRIEIVPENEIDEAFIEEVLGLKEEGESCACRREDVMKEGVFGRDSLTHNSLWCIYIAKGMAKE